MPDREIRREPARRPRKVRVMKVTRTKVGKRQRIRIETEKDGVKIVATGTPEAFNRLAREEREGGQ